MRPRLTLTIVLAIDAAGLWVLHDLADAPWARLATSAPPEDAVAAAVRLLALALGWWVAGSALVHGAVLVIGSATSGRLTGRLLVPPMRRLVEAALVTTLSVGRLAPAVAGPPIPPVVAVEQERMRTPTPEPGRAPTTEREPAPGRATHVVRSGEHLWAIAAAEVGGGPPQEVARYWRRLVAANRDRIRSGDPDLVFPGEVLRLPRR